ncbi:Premnaspirodiene oxygenase [Platanthera zijinensis]|uniref:Premnaspirodiene oxygenase n=1 Tax=Platanthera zijinensis TaxID=2320716 RepID=A0AAP0AYT2_9ASPA
MRLKLGEIRAVVVSSASAAKEILKTHDIAFASRPIYASINTISCGGKDIAFAPYGDFWRQMRRLCLLELFSAKRLQSFRYIREEEISSLVRSIAEAAGVSVDLSDKLSQLSNNITSRAVVGTKMADQKLFQSAVAGVVELASGFNAADLFPSMPFIARITVSNFAISGRHSGGKTEIWSSPVRFQRKVEGCQQKLEHISEEIIQEHKKKQGKLFPTVEDITDVLLRIQAEGNLHFPLTNDHIKAVISGLLVAGTSTTATVMAWAMSELIRNPAAKAKAQDEVRKTFGCRGMPNMIAGEEMMIGDKLSYLKLVIKETLRMHPPAPLLLPRENQESREVMGYEIPAKTMVMVNAWAIGRDSGSWVEPDAFRPERFDGSDLEFKGNHLELIPFGGGRRICPGMIFGLTTIEMALAHLLYYFDWEYSPEAGEELDMTEAPGLSTERKFPLLRLEPVNYSLEACSVICSRPTPYLTLQFAPGFFWLRN